MADFWNLGALGANNPNSGALGSNNMQWLQDNGYIGQEDAIMPGYSLLNKLFDFTGSSAAQQQYQNELSLQKQAQGFNAEESLKQRQWEEMMSSTQYQRLVRDMKAAGLNPYLAIAQMSPGGTPSGASAQSSSGSASMANNKLAQAASILAVVLRVLLTKR